MALPIHSEADNSDTEVLERLRWQTYRSQQTLPQQNAAQNQVFHWIGPHNLKIVSDKNRAHNLFRCSYRGYYSRKYEHDFYARKKYLQHVAHKNEEVRRLLDQHHSEKLKEQEIRAEECARTEFGELASNLHHLSSTKAIPGVYNPPYSQLKPQAFNVDIETHLKSTFKANY